MKPVLLDVSLKDSPPSLWTLSTLEGKNSWMKHKKNLNYEKVYLNEIDRQWRSVEHLHLGNNMTRFFYMNNNFPKESYTYDCKMGPCPYCGT